MQTIVFDMESNGLRPDILWCLVAKEVETGEVFRYGGTEGLEPFKKELQELFKSAEKVVAHNGCGFDFYWLDYHNIIPYSLYKHKRIDTLVWSYMLWPDRPWGHSVDKWAKHLGGQQKVEHEDWSKYSEDMLWRCESDVDIQCEIYNKLSEQIEGWELASRIEHRIAEISAEQEILGWPFDLDKAKSLVSGIQTTCDEYYETIKPILGPDINVKETKVAGEYNYVKKPFKVNGDYTKQVTDWFDDPSVVGGPFARIYFSDPDIGSRQKVQKHLLRLGWEPEEYTDKGSPKLTVAGEPVASLEKIAGDAGANLGKWYVLKHRQSQIQGWINNCREDGRIGAGVIPCATNTARMAHRVVTNVPKASDDVVMGKEMRSLFTCEPGYKLVGWDAEGLELRVLAHFMNDEDFISAIVEGDKSKGTDIHTLNQKATEKFGVKTRDDAKPIIYGLIYGAGDWKLGWIVGGGQKEGKQIREALMKRFPALETLIKRVQMASKRGYLKGLDGRKIWMRRDEKGEVMAHKALNTLIQSSGIILIKLATIYMYEMAVKNELDFQVVEQYHDENIIHVAEKDVHKMMKICEWAMPKAGEYFDFRCPLAANVLTGENWGEVH